MTTFIILSFQNTISDVASNEAHSFNFYNFLELQIDYYPSHPFHQTGGGPKHTQTDDIDIDNTYNLE